MSDIKMFGVRLKELRIKKELSLEEVKKDTGIAKSLLSRYERGIVIPGLEALITLSRYYKTSIDKLVESIKL